jgi:hypothetical protein
MAEEVTVEQLAACYIVLTLKLTATGQMGWQAHLKIPWRLLEQEEPQMASKHKCERQVHVFGVVSA